MALDTITTVQSSKAVRWSREELEVLLREYELALKPCGQARRGFIRKVSELMPQRTLGSIRHMLNRFVAAGKIPRQRDRRARLYRKVELSPVSAAWLAGILDGEGSIHKLQRGRRDGTSSNGYVVQLVLCYNTDLAIISRVAELVPPAKVHKRVNSGEGTKPIYNVTLSGYAPIRDVLQAILPYMVHTEKRTRGMEMLAFVTSRLGGA